MDTIDQAVTRAREAAADLARHPNNKPRIQARTMSLVALVRAFQDAGHVGSAQTQAADALGVDRQLIHRHIVRAVDRGWAEWSEHLGERKISPVVPAPEIQGIFSDVVDMETIGPPAATLPPFTFPQESTIV